jgi:hypothetical protein
MANPYTYRYYFGDVVNLVVIISATDQKSGVSNPDRL